MATRLSEQIIKEMGELIADGLPVIYACDYLGITDTSYYNWMEQGKADFSNDIKSLNATLFETIKKSYAQHIIDSKKRIQQGTPGWQGTAWWLERTNSFFMPKQQIQADDDGKVTVVIGGKEKNVKKVTD